MDQFKKGKHALTWAAMKAMPTFHRQPMTLKEGMKGCGVCHKQWTSDRAIILQALGVLDPEGNPTARPEVVKQADVARLTQEAWQAEFSRWFYHDV